TNAYVGSFYPTSDANGFVSFTWDLTDGNGNTFPDTNFLGVWTLVSSPGIGQSSNVKIAHSTASKFPAPTAKETLVRKVKAAGSSPGGGSSSSTPVTLWTKEKKWTPNNYWVVGVGDIGTQVAYQAVYGGVADPTTYGGIIGTLGDLKANIAPGNTTLWGNEYIVSDPITRSNLLAYLASLNPRYENFFWFGHGTENSISAEETGTTITEDQIADALGNVPLSDSALVKVALHPYRFTWFEACDTAKGNFCESFAIPAQDLSTNNFITAGLMSRAYLGYKNEVAFNASYEQGGRTSWDQESIMWNLFLSSFLRPTGTSLAADVYAAQNNYAPFQNATLYRMDSSATSYGATDMQYPDPW
ncbi:MAG: hypothetical protein ACREDS_13110, partial [Limisphaerales bacterium]